MEGIGSEVSHKIRAAIKAKLIELGAYVDDELPDYIMVMVANKRTRSQMDEDLQLFLTSNTKIFTSWLHTVLQKLHEVTVANFEGKKELEGKKSSKRKKLEEDGRSRKSSEEVLGKVKKHSKKHKESKKSKKNKHKSREKSKSRSGKKEEKDDGKEKVGKDEDEIKTSHNIRSSVEKKSKNKRIELNKAVGKAILGGLKKNEKLKSDKNEFSSQSSSSSEGSPNLGGKEGRENGNVAKSCKLPVPYLDSDVNKKTGEMDVNISNKFRKELIEDEFNIEPLKPAEKASEFGSVKDEKFKDNFKIKESSGPEVQTETTVSAPTEELLKEHNKLQKQKQDGEEKNDKKKVESGSEESLSPEEMRKQLLLSRTKKKLEESKLAERMRSNSPDVLILEETSTLGGKQKDLLPNSRSSTKQPHCRPSRSSKTPPRSGFYSKDSSKSGSPNHLSRKFSVSSHSSHYRRSRSPGISLSKKPNSDCKSKQTAEKSSNFEDKLKSSKVGRSSSPKTYDRDVESKIMGTSGERKRNIIKISESLELEKNLGVKKETDYKKSKEKETSSRRPVSSRVVTISDPETPEIPSIVKVKPRQYISKDKQANKALILKAVADAEKSIATIHSRNESEPEPKKLEALFTKNLRGKRYEKLAVTLSNIRKSPNSRDRTERRVSVDSDKSNRSRAKHGSSEVSEGVRGRSDMLSKKMSKSEDQFISSKTTVMEKNDKYIRCWLEGVEKAVQDDEMVNPNEMENLAHSHLTDEENDFVEGEQSKVEERKLKRPKLDETSTEQPTKNQKLSKKEIANLRLIPNSSSNDDGPQIVVTLDGLNSKTIKDIIMRNKEGVNGPILSAAAKKLKEKESKVTQRTSKQKSPPRKTGFERISDRFGRLNKTSEEGDRGRREKKGSKYQSTDKEKEKGSTESKNRQLIAQLSEKFGKVDREFENKKRKYPEDDRRYSYESRRNEKDGKERNGKYKKSERRSVREGGFGFCRGS